MKRIPGWLAILEIILSAFVILSILSILVYAAVWLLAGLSRKRHRPAERAMRVGPLVAALSLVAFAMVFILSSDDLITRMGNLTGWSALLFLTTIAFAVASVASVIAVWRAPGEGVRVGVRRYSMVIAVALVLLSLAYGGIIGLRIGA